MKPPAFVDLSHRRSPSHRRPKMPPVETLLARIRAGEAVEDIAAELDRVPSTIYLRINQAGFSAKTGRPIGDGLPLLRSPFEYPEWYDRALCAQTDPEAFFPEKGGSTREAKKVCQTCEVAAECLDYALDHDERFGIWGGLSERDRRRIKRQLAADNDTQQEA